MKAFVIAVILFLALVLFLFGSSAALTGKVLSLTGEAKVLATLPTEERAEAARALCKRWDEERLLFVIFVHEEELVPLESALTRTRAAAEIESDSDFLIAVAEVTAELSHLEWQVGTHIEGIV